MFVERAQGAAARAAVYELRYAVYVEEQGKPYASADRARRELTDPLDSAPNAEVLAASSGGQVIGTVRWNSLIDDIAFERYAAELELERFQEIPRRELGVCSRLAVLPAYRDITVRAALFDAIYDIGLARRTRLCFATCLPRLTRLFRAYGFRIYAPPIVDPTVGKLERLLLHLNDLSYLEQIGSPFSARFVRFNSESEHAHA
jgi:predicted GNAT family N-acyltransferase